MMQFAVAERLASRQARGEVVELRLGNLEAVPMPVACAAFLLSVMVSLRSARKGFAKLADVPSGDAF